MRLTSTCQPHKIIHEVDSLPSTCKSNQGRRKLIEVRGTWSKIYIQDGYFLVNVYINFIVDNTKTTYGRLHLWQGILQWIANLFIKRLNSVIKCCGFF